MKLTRLAPLLGTVVVMVGLFVSPALDRIDGLSLDTLFLLRQVTFGALHEPIDSPTVVIAIDESSYKSEEFIGLPIVMWTPQLGRVIDAVKRGGATVIGFDLILPTSVERYIPDYDRPFLQSLKRAADNDRIVLAKAQHETRPILPFVGQRFAVGHTRNIRAVNLETDGDGVVRRVPLFFEGRGKGDTENVEPSFAAEIVARAGENGGTIGSTRLADSRPGPVLLNFDGGPGAIPTYSFADLAACATRGDAAYFERAFAGKIVLFGGVLDVEDRKLTSKRFITGRERENAPPSCVLNESENRPGPSLARQSIAGLYVHATAINNLLQGDALSVPSRPIIALILLALCGLAATVSQMRHIGRGVLCLGVGVIFWLVVCVGIFQAGVVLPLIDFPLAGVVAFAVPAAFRLAVTDRERNRIRRAFSFYLAPAVIERMLAGNRMPVLGGETRTVTVLFSDVEGFSAISEGLAPAALVRVMNIYLGAMTELIEAQGGFVDKYIGDAIVAVFGAPYDEPDHAVNAVRAALACEARLASLQGELALSEGRQLKARIGISTGPALVGNIGSQRRFNYTVMGDTVNLAARLESANKQYGSRVLTAHDTVVACGDRIPFREVDRVIVKGRGQATTLFEPLAAAGSLGNERAALVTAYGLALAHYRAGRFAEAVQLFDALARHDRVSATMAERSRRFLAQPPQPWQGVIALDNK